MPAACVVWVKALVNFSYASHGFGTQGPTPDVVRDLTLLPAISWKLGASALKSPRVARESVSKQLKFAGRW